MTVYSLDVLLFVFGTNLCSMSSSNCCFLTCIQISQEAGQVVWYSHLFWNLPQFIVIHTVKGFGIVNKAEIDVFLELSCFFSAAVQCCLSAKSRTWPSDFTFTFHFHALEKAMAMHSSVLAWRIPGTAEPGRLLSMGSHVFGHDWSDLAVAAAC